VSFLTARLTPKRFELLMALVPQAKLIGLLANPKNPQTPGVVTDLQRVVQARGLELQSLEASNGPQIEEAFARFHQIHVDALIVQSDPFFNAQGDQLVSLTQRYALPAIYERRAFISAGGLMSYGTSLPEVYQGVSRYVAKILDGAKPPDLPVLQPTKFELFINLKTAKALGLTVPQELLVRADEVIE
jgi:putative ABC transport system substrate-binding protein